ncbi:MAG TPA: ABC transporter permease [Xanthobacteraceae bacterium]|jgi:putative ABC transport system permease protein
MLRHNLTTAFRNLAKHRLYSFINIAGLSVGLACAVFIVLFLRDELSYDKWIPDSANLYRVEVDDATPGRDRLKLAVAPFPMPRAMQEQIPEVKAMTRLAREPMDVKVGDRQFSENVDVVDPNFFQVIKLPLTMGDPADVLAQPESIVLSQSEARKYFGDADPIGKTMVVTEGSGFGETDRAIHSLTVTGVFRDLPHNTHLAADFILPNSSQADGMPQSAKDSWVAEQSYGYVLLAPNADPQTVLAKLNPIIDQNFDPSKNGGPKMRGSEEKQAHLTQIWDSHLTSDNNIGAIKPGGSWTTVYGFAVIAMLILLVACFNFTNLATARAMMRAREIYLRKVAGATRQQLILQFLGEAVMTALLALIIALALVEVLLPTYDQFLDRPIAFHYLPEWQLLLAIIAGAIAAGLIGGAYPALILSRHRPADVLRTNAFSNVGAGGTRMALVVLQFAVSIGLGIAVMVVFRQIDFARHADLGFNHDGLVIISAENKLPPTARESFAHALANSPAIVGVAESSTVPFMAAYQEGKVQVPGNSQVSQFRMMDLSPEFPELYEMQLTAGRLLSSKRGEDMLPGYIFTGGPATSEKTNDNRNVLINAQAARRLSWSANEAVGKVIILEGLRVVVAGVLADPKIDGVKSSVSPMVYGYSPEDNAIFSVRIHGAALSDAISHIDKTWKSFVPGSPVQRFFLDDSYEDQFKSDEQQGRMFSFFVGIAIFIACLGLFGLAAFTAQRRTKEIGVRKVFGARSADIVRLLLWQFSIPVMIANAIAWPVSYYYLRHWLDSYAYRISLNPVYFVLAGAMALAIAWCTVFVHALRVSRASPIRALRYE